MVSTPEDITENSPTSISKYELINKPTARKSLHHFSEVLNAKQKNSVHILGASK